MVEIELTTLDLRYESYRMKKPAAEARLLASISQRGITESLEGVDGPEVRILLNRFKRYRCAHKLGIATVPYASLGILEQAGFIDDLRNLHKMSVAEIAADLSRSKAWVSMRLGLIGEMGAEIRTKLFVGAFPVYSYMYTMRQFMRMNGVQKAEVEAFVAAVSGKRLSV